jgi:CheY-like chemotaxis protein
VPRVLVIDDEPAIRGVLRASLEASGFEVALA